LAGAAFRHVTTPWGIAYLDWNAPKWVVGYRGTSELLIAL